jgi:hypothetical protein
LSKLELKEEIWLVKSWGTVAVLRAEIWELERLLI